MGRVRNAGKQRVLGKTQEHEMALLDHSMQGQVTGWWGKVAHLWEATAGCWVPADALEGGQGVVEDGVMHMAGIHLAAADVELLR